MKYNPLRQGLLKSKLKIFEIKSFDYRQKASRVNKELVNYLTKGHLTTEIWTDRHTQLFLYVMEGQKDCMRQHVMKWGQMLPKLSNNDLNHLWGKNSDLFKQYIIGRYLTAESNTSQLYWLFGHDAPDLGVKINVLCPLLDVQHLCFGVLCV